jgi:hypothetical protein
MLLYDDLSLSLSLSLRLSLYKIGFLMFLAGGGPYSTLVPSPARPVLTTGLALRIVITGDLPINSGDLPIIKSFK